MVGPELLVDGRIHEHVQLGETDIGASGVPVGADGDGGQHGGVQPVPHGIDDGHVQDVVVQGVAEAVTRDVVGRLEDSGHRDLRCDHGQRGQQ
ncbi:predicted protein [Streptomyces iranensis]|uniref:Uncharacterized protein n=1 Tax=Streptomyces iranensis TaxID=576784 RepID=A0A060ZQW5_9ACTN|nr:hypothetical protein [Streptomyces iranensis]CDR08191.1 predicted protein [Streptomyces iranensis]